ncbi:fungal-specific transcription factor domain-containing protein [Chaetomium fimeti]|uniref:Fungal-specific transcription factor domain-containing protein n=1 Tax=Chaetomium fimeti TaxID=1854472 RepID=A0AAE0LW83_9PEZI|nr:fungal-specific transcription factor domain-containing protein [Chaetomium fimeti]
MTVIVEAIEYYNAHIAPDLIATGSRGPRTPYWMPPITASILPRSFTQSIVCTSLCHRILQSSDAAPSDQVVLARRLQRHRGDALQALTADLGKQKEPSDVTLASVLTLLLVEIQQSFEPPNWRNHGNGAAVMIELKGGLQSLVLSRPFLRHLFRYYALIEAIGNTTSPRVEMRSARSQLELVSLLPVFYGNGLSTCFPCPPDLLAEIIHINHLRSVFQGGALLSADKDSTPREEDGQDPQYSAAMDVLRRIRSFSTDKWAAEVTVSITRDENTAPPGLSGWHAIACIYQSAVAIYCIASLLHEAVGSPDQNTELVADAPLTRWEVLTEVRSMYASTLLSRLHQVSKCTQLRKLVLWPLFVMGVEAEDEETKRFVMGELRWISNALGTAAPLVAKDLLEKRVWKLGMGKGGWDAMFDQSYVFVL